MCGRSFRAMVLVASVILATALLSGCQLGGEVASPAPDTPGALAPLDATAAATAHPIATVAASEGATEGPNPNPPTETVKLIFIHHSCGENWLADDDGGLGIALRDNNYFVSDTNYGWGPEGIGDRTDITDWPEWFRSPHSSTYLDALYTEYGDHSGCYSRGTDPDPGRENEIILFKSCYPNSNLEGRPDDPLAPGEGLTVSNAKHIYNDLLQYFATRPDKLFVAITAPPVTQDDSYAPPANARAFNNWLVNNWLDGYPLNNVAVFDFYNVLTSNGGNADTNDVGAEEGNHHRWWGGAVQHIQTVDNDLAAHPTGDSHPSQAGNQKATAEFVSLLNVYCSRWRGGTGASAVPTQAALSPSPIARAATVGTTEVPTGRIEPSDLIYRGAFAYPAGDAWAYSGHALAFYPDGDPGGQADGFPGSLYAAGSASDDVDLVGEISIPQPVIVSDFEALPQASVLQPLADITEGWKDNCTYASDCIYRNVDGLEYLPNVDKIVWNLRDWYNTSGQDQDSLGWSNLDMTDAQGVWHIGDRPSDDDLFHNAKACNYLLKAPQSFADQSLDGKWLIAGNHREAGALGGSQGPSLYALAPWEDGDPPASGQNLDALALLYYPEVYECIWEGEGNIHEHPAEGVCHFPGYRGSDKWGGAAWVQTADESAILIFGRKALGDNCYGPTTLCGEDPCEQSSGYHAYPYEPQILFYDPDELREVVAGSRQPWEVLPYAVHTVEEVFDAQCGELGAAAYDPERGLIYVTETEAGPWGETAVHVWEVQ